jgi:hypothetical protein
MKIYLQLGLLLLLAACQSANQNTQETTSTVTNEATEEYVEPAKITFDETSGKASITRNFYFIFDVSGSMDEPCANERKIDGAKKAINEFLNKVPDDVNIGLLFLGVSGKEDEIEEVVPLGGGKKREFMDAINAIQPHGRTPLGFAMNFAIGKLIDQYKLQLGYGEYRLITITDGLATDMSVFEQSMTEIRRYPFIALYGVGLCMEEDNPLKSKSIKYTDAHNYDELGKALEQTISELETFDPAEFSQEDLDNLQK